jgi:hypothetical protein
VAWTFAPRCRILPRFAIQEQAMPINHFDLQRFEAIKVRESTRKAGSPDRFGKESNAKNDKKLDNPLLGKLLKSHVPDDKK